METIKFELSKKDYKLLMKVLEEASDYRGDMTCNDADEREEKLYTKKERMAMIEMLDEDFDSDEDDPYLANFEYVNYLIMIIKKQKNDSKKN